MGRLVGRGRAFNCVNVLFTLLAVSFWLLALHIVMLKFAVKREQSQACLSYAEREQIERS